MIRSKDIFFEQMQGEQADAEEQFLQMEEQQALSKSLNIFEQGLTKEDVPALAEAMVSHVLETGNVLSVAENIKVMETLMDSVKEDKRFKNYALDEIGKCGKTFTSSRGVKIELAEVGTKYDFTKCGDPEWEMMDAETKSLAEKKKAREAFLKTVPNGGLEVIFEDQVIKVYPPVKTSTSSYKITLPK